MYTVSRGALVVVKVMMGMAANPTRKGTGAWIKELR